ncbi:hypothetical protein D3C76_893020 [compost metagenome]
MGNASPPVIIRRLLKGSGLLATSACHSVGVACIIVAPVFLILFANAYGSRIVSLVAISILAPVVRGSNISRTDISNAIVVTARSRSFSFNLKRFCMLKSKLVKLPKVTITPFGLPVEPEV